jgi:prepilin-type N-terminal cleavage/methylation domain-containing protein
MTPAKEPWRVLSSEAGFTLTEMVTVLGILGTVLAALSTMFVAGLRSEADMNQRFQAQQQVRVGFTKLRRDVRCASAATTTPASVTLTLGAYCPTSGGVATQMSWCAVSLGPQNYGLFRQPGPTCGITGAKQAEQLTSNAIFSNDLVSGTRPRLHVLLAADADPSSSAGTYRLEDSITLRNSLRWYSS